MENHVYICIDLKSFYASAECVSRHLDPLTTNLVVADVSRTEKTICLAVSPSLKAVGIPGRPRLFEVVRKVRRINQERLLKAPHHTFDGESSDSEVLAKYPNLKLNYIVATPRMAYYIDISSRIYGIYLKYIAKEDIHVYSIDEVFMDVTKYLKNYGMTPHQLAMTMIQDVLKTTGITATAGIGPNMYLAKVAMDIVAKHIPPDKDGVRIAELDELGYRKQLWDHTPLTDFWRLGPGYEKRLNRLGLYTMGDVAKCSVGPFDQRYNENLLFKEFGVNAELLIDHAWGYEPTTIADVKAYKPQNNSLSSGQVLHEPYPADKAKIVAKEMAETLSLTLVSKGLKTLSVGLSVGYDASALEVLKDHDAHVVVDRYGRTMPKPSGGSIRFDHYTASTEKIVQAISGIFDAVVDPRLTIRRLNVVAANTLREDLAEAYDERPRQLSLFEAASGEDPMVKEDRTKEKKEAQVQKALLAIRNRYGKNAVLNGTSFEEGANERERNKQIGGHKA